MRKVDVFRALFTSLYTANEEMAEEDRNPKLIEYIDKYMPNFGKDEPPKDASVMQQFKKFIDKRCKEDELDEEDGYKYAKGFIHDTTEFGEIFARVNLEDWKSLCDMIDMSNMVNAINAMKDAGTYESMIKNGQGDQIGDYIKAHPELMEKASANVGAGAMSGMGAGASAAAAKPAKKTVHPNQKKKKKKK